MRFNKTNGAKKSTLHAAFKLSLKFLTQVFLLFTTSLILYSCKKTDLDKKNQQVEQLTSKSDIQKILESDFFVQNRKVADMGDVQNSGNSFESTGWNEYSNETPIVLGGQLPIPYSIPVMTEAYNTYYASNLFTVPVTDFYVRFSPANEMQLTLLEDSLDLDLYDYPLDYEVITDGDYYIQPGKQPEDMPHFYTTVPVDFQFPAGISYTILEQLHFPHNDVILEALAESIAAGGHYTSLHPNSGSPEVLMTRVENGSQLTNLNECFCDPTPQQLQCVAPDPNCGGGDPGGGGPGGPGGNPTPPPPGTQARGNVVVWDTQLSQYVPVQSVRIRVKRGLRGVGKRNYFYTDANGNFVSQLGFTGNFKLNIKFKNATVSVRAVRAYRVKMSLNGVVDKRGRHPLNSNLQLQIPRPSNINDKRFAYWTAANVVNGIHKYAFFTAQEQIPHYNKWRLNFFITKNNTYYEQEAFVMAPMKRAYKRGFGVDDFFDALKFALYTVKAVKTVNPGAIYNAIAAAQSLIFQADQPDIILGYNTAFENLTSNGVKQKIYEGLANGSLFMKTPKIQWKAYGETMNKISDFANSASQYITYSLQNGFKFNPLDPTIISMASSLGFAIYYAASLPNPEMWQIHSGWANYYGHYIASKEYPTLLSAPVKDQKRQPILSTGTQSSHLIYIENWDPSFQGDVLRQSGRGLFNDIIDGSGETTPVIDNFSGTTNKKLYGLITGTEPNIPNPGVNAQSFLILKVRLIYNFPQQDASIQTLFNAYGK